jgi:hypothetical protein
VRELRIFIAGRPLVLLPSVARVWEACRSDQLSSWEEKNLREYDWTARGKSSETAVWRTLLDDEICQDGPFSSGTALLDLAKAYEYVSLNMLWTAAIFWGCPLDIIGLALELYAAPRRIQSGGAFSDAFATMCGLPAGSKYANKLLKILLRLPLDIVGLRFHRTGLIEYVDDIAIRYLGTVGQVAAKLPAAVAWLIHFLESVLKLVVSRGVKGKSVFLGANESVRAALRAPMQQLSLNESWNTRWLGIDYFGGGAPKKNVTRQARQATAKHRWTKIATLKKKRVKVRAVVTQGLRASLAYGAKCSGTPGPILGFIRAKLAATRLGAGPFRSATLNEAMSGKSDAAPVVLAPLRAWAEAAWERPEWANALEVAWKKQVPRIKRAWENGGAAEAWACVSGPAGAVWVTVAELGWEMPGPFVVAENDSGTTDLNSVCPREVMQAAEETYVQRRLERWAQARPERLRLSPRPWLLPARQLLGRRSKAEWTPRHKNIVRCAVLGGFVDQAALYACGRASSPLCPLCLAEEGTNAHFYFRCQHQDCTAARAAITRPDDDASFRDIVQIAAASADALKWERGLVVDPTACFETAIPEAQVFYESGGQSQERLLSGIVGTDGSLLNGGLAGLRAAGWAAVNVAGDGLLQLAIFGPLPFARPSILAAEIYAVHIALENALDIRMLCIDNAEVIRCLSRGRVYSTASGRQFAHLWRRIWHRLEDIGYQTALGSAPADGKIIICKVKAHRTAVEKANLPSCERRLCELNEVADLWAKVGAKRAAPPPWQVTDVKEKLGQAKRALEYVAAFRIAATDVVHTRADLDEANAATRGQARSARRAPRDAHRVFAEADGTFRCADCGAHTKSAAKAAELGRKACAGAAELLWRVRQPAIRRRISKKRPARAHVFGRCGPYVFCVTCGLYAGGRIGRLTEECEGPPLSRAPKDVMRMLRRERLVAGRHPVSGERLAAGGVRAEGEGVEKVG